ncbi:GntR family transcriptional regulator [Amycolatopsis sp. lyj-84]|uniref:GntR family transcriptional regulator n=1 Tax=Amycolatopsis sp. lyj-84 TaxID=2789284 RepID=UPI00397CEB1D
MERVDAKSVAEQLRAAIRDGELPQGATLPTNEALRERFGVGKNVVSAAIQTLKGEGVLTGGRGGPVRVRVTPKHLTRSNTAYQEEKDLVREPEEVRRRRGSAERDANVDIKSVNDDRVTYEVVSPPDDITEILGLESGEYVLRRTYLRQYQEGEGYSRMISYIPYHLVKDHPPLLDSSNEPWPGGTQHQLFTAGVEVEKIVDQVTARMPTEEESGLYDIPFSVPVLAIRKLTYDTAGRVVDVGQLLIPGDRALLEYVTVLRKW